MNDGNGYVWLYENLTESAILDATFFFDLNNLQILPDEDEEEKKEMTEEEKA